MYPTINLSESISITNADCKAVIPFIENIDCLFLDPPFDIWDTVPFINATTSICMTNWQNRMSVEQTYGKPRTELIWHMPQPRWVSHTLPLPTHESILVYGKTNEIYVAEKCTDTEPIKKGKSSIGKWKKDGRIYQPRERKGIRSVLTYNRDLKGYSGCWTKPLPMIELLLDWIQPAFVVDPYMGSSTVGVACINKGIKYLGIENDEKVFNIAKQRLECALSSM
jgi:hypothetical protein